MSSQEFRIVSSDFRVVLSSATNGRRVAMLPIGGPSQTSRVAGIAFPIIDLIAQQTQLILTPTSPDLGRFLEPTMSSGQLAEQSEQQMLASEMIRIVWTPELADPGVTLVHLVKAASRRYGRSGTMIVFMTSKHIPDAESISSVIRHTTWNLHIQLQAGYQHGARADLWENVCLRLLDLAVLASHRMSLSQTTRCLIEKTIKQTHKDSDAPGWQCANNARSYYEFTQTYTAYTQVAQALLDFYGVQKQVSAGDLGCGTGVSTRALKGYLAELGCTVTGYDSSREMLSFALSHRSSEIRYCDFSEVFNAQHDLLVASASIWQLAPEDIRRIYTTVLNRCGTMIYNIPEAFSSSFPYLCNQDAFELLVGLPVRNFRSGTFMCRCGVEEMAAYGQIPVFRDSATKLSPVDKGNGSVTNWLIIEITKP